MAGTAQTDPRDWNWSTKVTAREARVREWASLLSQEIAEMAVSSDAERQFSASWTRYGLGPLELNFLKCSRQVVSRSPEMVARDTMPFFELLFARMGSIAVRHGESRSIVPQGCFVLLDDQIAYDLDFPEGSDCLTVRMPEQWLSSWTPCMHEVVGLPLGLRSPWGRPLAGLLTAVADSGLAQMVLSRNSLSDQLGSMVALLADSSSHDLPPLLSGISSRARDIISAMCGDRDLDPARVARELSISVRHLHRSLARSGTSFGRVLNTMRIAAARNLLLSQEGRNMSIGEIAWHVGYSDQSHFARLFKQAHGCSPSQYRQIRQQ